MSVGLASYIRQWTLTFHELLVSAGCANFYPVLRACKGMGWDV
jgi:hypothetical protein